MLNNDDIALLIMMVNAKMEMVLYEDDRKTLRSVKQKLMLMISPPEPAPVPARHYRYDPDDDEYITNFSGYSD